MFGSALHFPGDERDIVFDSCKTLSRPAYGAVRSPHRSAPREVSLPAQQRVGVLPAFTSRVMISRP